MQTDESFAFVMRAAFAQEEHRAHSVFEVLHELVGLLKAVRIDATVLKGAALARSVYSAPAFRHCHDIDLLIARSELARAQDALRRSEVFETMSGKPWDDGGRCLHRSGLPVELHCRLFVLAPRGSDDEAILERRRTERIGALEFRALSPGDGLLHVCGHAAASRSRDTLRWACDAWHLVEKMTGADWKIFRDAVRATKLALPVYVMLRYLRQAVGADVPEAELRALRNAAHRIGRGAREMALIGARRGERGTLRDLWLCTRRLRSRLAFFRWRIMPTSVYLAAIHPESQPWEVWTFYPRRTLAYLVRLLRRFGTQETREQKDAARRSILVARWRRERSIYQRPWIPTPRQLLLVQAAVLPGNAARRAWDLWRTESDFGCADPATEALLPIAYRNLQREGETDPTLDRARLAYQMTWLTNERLFRAVADVLRVLTDSGIETMILKGTALALLHYRDLGCRSVGDIDLLVPPDRLRDALALLTGRGFRRLRHPPLVLTETYLASQKALNLVSAEIPNLDLHWRVLQMPYWAGCGEEFWDQASAVSLHGAPTRAMSAPDQIVHICAHEAQWVPSPLPRWMVDLVTVMRSVTEVADADRIVSLTRRLELVLPVLEVLGVLDEVFPGVVHSGLLAGLRNVEVTRRDRHEYEIRCRRPGPYQAIRAEYLVHCRRSAGLSTLRRWLAFPDYIQSLLGLERKWQLPPELLARGLRTVRRAAALEIDRARRRVR